jgi:tRNA threonylcarbamoyladenosine biosynthesis protein TsaE
MSVHLTRDPGGTHEVGRAFASSLVPGDVVALFGTLGSGKTHFTMGVCEGLRVNARVTSPTFTIINEYDAPFGKVAHIDLYRIEKRTEVEGLGIEEYFNDKCICVIEWPEIIADILPLKRWEVRITHVVAEDERQIAIERVMAS